MTIRINVDGQLGTGEDRLLSPLDQGFLFGASVYETVRTYDGVAFLVERHLKRLHESARALGIDFDESDETLMQRIHETLEASGDAESSVRIVVSAGVGAIDYRQGSTKKPTIVIVVRPLQPFPESLYQDGATASFVSIMRAGRGNLSPRIKSSNLLNNLMALRQAHERGAYEALMLNPKGEVCEGSMSNVFVVTDATIATPPISAGILEGITRELVISIAREGGLDLEERILLPDELLGTDEVFITASSRQVVPIVKVDEQPIADGRPGPITQKLISLYREKVHALMHDAEGR